MKFPHLACALACALTATTTSPALCAPATSTPTHGGEGGKIIRVTTLAPDGPGSLKAAVETKGKRIVVFEVGGVIDLGRSVLTISEPYLTVAGQTAPSPGITLIRGGIDVKGHDVILSNMRVMTGVDGQPKLSGWEADAFSTGAAYNVIVEHCSFFWALDENMSASGPRFSGKTVEEWRRNTSHNILFRENLASEGLANASHPKGEHSKGSLIHDNATHITFYRNLWAHNMERSPLVKGGAQVLMVNNMIFNPGHRALHYNLMNMEWAGHEYVTGEITAVGNVMRAGNSTQPGMPFLTLGGDGDLAWYSQDNVNVDRWGKPAAMFGRYGVTKAKLIEQQKPMESFAEFDVLPAAELETSLLATVGARPWDRSDDELRVLAFVAEGRGEIIDDEKSVGGYPRPAPTRATFVEKDWNLKTMTPHSGIYPGQKTAAVTKSPGIGRTQADGAGK